MLRSIACLLLALVPALHAASPNVVLIFTDDQGYGDAGCYGEKRYATPHLDRMAAEGVRFTDFYVSSPVCSASRAALLTGCYHSRVGIHGALGPRAATGLNPDEMTIAEVVKQKGYATAMLGKWHLGDHPSLLPVRQGFDTWAGLPYSNDMWPLHPQGGNWPVLPFYENDRITDAEVTHEDQNQLTAGYTARAVEFIRAQKDKPFFLYLAHSMPHVPLHVSDRFRGKSGAGLYGDVIQEIDWSVGEVLRTLKETGLDEKTLVIFTSDNGPWLSYGNHAGSAGPLREGKGTCWEGGIRVPCLMRWPGQIPAGQVRRQMAGTIDMLPTIAEITGAALPEKKIDGRSLLPLLKDDSTASPHEVLFYYYDSNALHALRSGKWKLQLPHTWRACPEPRGKDGIPSRYGQVKLEQAELYDLDADIAESRNVAASNPDVLARLLALADTARRDLGDSLTKQKGSGVRPAASVKPEAK